MAHYSVLAVTPTSEEWIPDYIGPVNALVAKHGGKYLARTASQERLEGEGEDAALRVIIEWPSKEAAKAFMSDPDYVPHLQARTAGSSSNHFLIEGRTTSPEGARVQRLSIPKTGTCCERCSYAPRLIRSAAA